jgi:FKBP-type peptidyl-prolyl cis-trans isomerase
MNEITHKLPFQWEYNTTYSLLVMTASDSAANTTLYSGYIHLPNENKWKLVHSSMISGSNTIKNIFAGNMNTKKYSVQFNNRWLLRSTNSWKALDSQTTKPPVLRPMSNIDSIAQQKKEVDELNSKLPKDSVTYTDGIFYQSLKEGNGRLVTISDTVVIHYKGWLFSNGNVFDQTKEKPATFPLSRLIRGWQIGVPQCRVGGTIRLFIPSGSAYGIRTLSTSIPPNSTLVFDVEVLEVKEKL